MSAVEELCKQVLHSIEGLEGRMRDLLDELPEGETRESWRSRFNAEAENLQRITSEETADIS